jgi:hypothetical protein
MPHRALLFSILFRDQSRQIADELPIEADRIPA